MTQQPQSSKLKAQSATVRQAAATLVWGRDDELAANRRGELHPNQRKRIKQIAIFDPWLRLLLSAFLLIFAFTQRLESWQFWLPLMIAALPLGSAINGLLAGRRLTMAKVEVVEGIVSNVRPHRSEAVAATLHRDKLYMFLLNYDGSAALPSADTPYRFYVVFGVLRPGIVVAVESIQEKAV